MCTSSQIVTLDKESRVVIPKLYREALHLQPKANLKSSIYKNSVVFTLDRMAPHETSIDHLGRIVIPAAARRALDLRPRQSLKITLVDKGFVFTSLECTTAAPAPKDAENPLLDSAQNKLKKMTLEQLILFLALMDQVVAS